MTEKGLEEAQQLKNKIDKFEAAKKNNFQINIHNFEGNIEDSDLRPDTQAKIKQLLIDELKCLKEEFENI